jgi:hypothetical protein
MKDHLRSFLRLLSVLVLTLTLRSVSAQSMPPSGSFGFLINASYSDLSNNNGFVVLGVLNFGGAGSVTGSYTVELGSSPTQTSQPITGTFTGTYSGNPDGTGTLTTTADNGTVFTFATFVTDGGQGLQFVATNCPCNMGPTTFSGVARAAYTGSLNAGSYGFQGTNSPTPAASLGVVKFDGVGNVSMSVTLVGLSGASGQPNISPEPIRAIPMGAARSLLQPRMGTVRPMCLWSPTVVQDSYCCKRIAQETACSSEQLGGNNSNLDSMAAGA